MGQESSIRSSKLFYLGLPILLLILYVVFVPSPSVSKIHIQDSLAYIAEGYDFTILRVSPDGQIIHLSSHTLPYWVRNFTIENGLAYVITGDNSVHIIDVRDPISLRKLASWNLPGRAHSVAIEGDFAFVANHTDGLHVSNIQVPSRPFQLVHINNLGTVLDVAAAQNLIYIARGSDGLNVYNTNIITKPELIGHYDADGAINRITLLSGNRALLQVNKQSLIIVNISNAQSIIPTNTFTADSEIVLAKVYNRRIFVVQRGAGVLILNIKEDGTLEQLTDAPNTTLYNPVDAASIDNTIFIAARSGGVQAVDISKLEDIKLINSHSRFLKYKLFIGLLVAAAMLFWLAFFAQFVLPVRTFDQRQKIFRRLIIFLLGRHGSAIFIENGRARERGGESQRKGPGVLWLDSASASVIRTATKFKDAIGPGVHFTEKNEYIAGTVDLHTQVDTFGPHDDQNPFMVKPDATADQSERDKYDEIQKRRMEVSALTRDGIEVVPKISVTFRVNTLPSAEGHPGSRFGYRTGISKIDKENEASDKEAIYKAITGEGINRYRSSQRVAWNQLPMLLAVDVWREYLAKFTLDELYNVQEVPPAPLALPAPAGDRIDQSEDVAQNGEKQGQFQQRYTSVLHDLNEKIAAWLDHLEGKSTKKDEKQKDEAPASSLDEAANKTALQIINEMVKARLTMYYVQKINSIGQREPGFHESIEYQLLKARGLKVMSVNISNPRVDEIVEKQRVDQWKASWLSNATAERDRIARQRGFVEIQGQENGTNEYAHGLARHIMKQKPSGIKEIVKALLMRTRLIIIQRDRLQRRMVTERDDLEAILQWLEESA